MKLIAAKCPNCGANIEVDRDSDSTKCEYCNSKIIVEDAIQKIKMEMSGSVVVENLPKADNYVLLGNRAFESADYSEAYAMFSKAVELDPNNYMALIKRAFSKELMIDYTQIDAQRILFVVKQTYSILKDEELEGEADKVAVYVCDNLALVWNRFFNGYFSQIVKYKDAEHLAKQAKCFISVYEFLFEKSKDIILKNEIAKILVKDISFLLDGFKYSGQNVNGVYKVGSKDKNLFKKKLEFYANPNGGAKAPSESDFANSFAFDYMHVFMSKSKDERTTDIIFYIISCLLLVLGVYLYFKGESYAIKSIFVGTLWIPVIKDFINEYFKFKFNFNKMGKIYLILTGFIAILIVFSILFFR